MSSEIPHNIQEWHGGGPASYKLSGERRKDGTD